MVDPLNAEPFLMKVCIVCCTCDLPARASVQNFVQFNGLHGCYYSELPGKTVTTKNGGHVHAFPYNLECPKGPPPRSQQTCLQYAREAAEVEITSGHRSISMHFVTMTDHLRKWLVGVTGHSTCVCTAGSIQLYCLW